MIWTKTNLYLDSKDKKNNEAKVFMKNFKICKIENIILNEKEPKKKTYQENFVFQQELDTILGSGLLDDNKNSKRKDSQVKF